MAKLTNGKRIGPGEFAGDLDGKPVVLHESARSVPRRLNDTIGFVSGLSQADPALEKARQEDTKAAIEALANGDLSNIRERLASQAIATDAMAHRLLQTSTLVKKPEDIDLHLRHAEKMFDSSRKALATLAEIRNPKRSATFVKQQNNLMVASSGEPAAAAPRQLGESVYGGVEFKAAARATRQDEEIKAVAAVVGAKN
jgi:hypothetical protein